ncbi:MAG TPA: hypothetical protein VHV51_07940 [Polyangiaceae bacterium]|nr:hypothetical protein [Polyangiaceae bacterium]
MLLKLGENEFLHVAAEADGAASVEIPQGVRLKPGSDLPVLVYRASPATAPMIPRWQVVGTVHVPEQ